MATPKLPVRASTKVLAMAHAFSTERSRTAACESSTSTVRRTSGDDSEQQGRGVDEPPPRYRLQERQLGQAEVGDSQQMQVPEPVDGLAGCAVEEADGENGNQRRPAPNDEGPGRRRPRRYVAPGRRPEALLRHGEGDEQPQHDVDRATRDQGKGQVWYGKANVSAGDGYARRDADDAPYLSGLRPPEKYPPYPTAADLVRNPGLPRPGIERRADSPEDLGDEDHSEQ